MGIKRQQQKQSKQHTSAFFLTRTRLCKVHSTARFICAALTRQQLLLIITAALTTAAAAAALLDYTRYPSDTYWYIRVAGVSSTTNQTGVVGAAAMKHSPAEDIQLAQSHIRTLRLRGRRHQALPRPSGRSTPPLPNMRVASSSLPLLQQY